MKTSTVWLFGLSGAGKTTIAEAFIKKHPDWISLDGDKTRQNISKDLGFSPQDRIIHLRRVIELSKMINNNEKNVICSFITPLKEIRSLIREELNSYLVFIDCSLKKCIQRDPKGFYKKALKGEINDFTGIGSSFDYPEDKELDLRIYTDLAFDIDITSSLKCLEDFLRRKNVI